MNNQNSEPIVRIEMFDTTLRDGAQSLPACNQFGEGSKSVIADKIAQLGINVIEAGFPATPGDESEVKDVAYNVGNNVYPVSKWSYDPTYGTTIQDYAEHTPVIAGLSRCLAQDIDTCWNSVKLASKPRIHTFISTDPLHMNAKFPGKTPGQVLKMGQQAILHAIDLTSQNSNASVEFSAEAATTTDGGFLQEVISMAQESGADIVNLPDTVGQREPFFMYEFYKKILNVTKKDTVISAHNHNDLGLAVANSYSLVKAACDYAKKYKNPRTIQIEATLCGLGERAGNADVFSTVASIFQFARNSNVALEWQFNPEMSLQIASFVMAQAELSVDRQNPVVGADINTHRSGIHSDGVIKGGHKVYTPFDPVCWGHMANANFENGKYQGKNGRRLAGINQ